VRPDYPASFDAFTVLNEPRLPPDGSSYRTSPNATKCKAKSTGPGVLRRIPDNQSLINSYPIDIWVEMIFMP
jgi:hypothetical protein